MRKLQITDEEMGLLARMLRKVDFFQPLNVGQIEQVLPHIGLYEFDPGETVFSQGEAGDAFFIVHKGKVEVKVKKGFLSFSKHVATLGPGAFFGEMALISKEPRNASVACLEKTQLFVLVSQDFQYVIGENPAAAAEMKNIAARRKFETSRVR